MCVTCVCTSFAGVINEDYLLQECVWRAVNDRVDGAQQSAPGLVVEHDHHAGARKIIWIQLVLATAQERDGQPLQNTQHDTHKNDERVG